MIKDENGTFLKSRQSFAMKLIGVWVSMIIDLFVLHQECLDRLQSQPHTYLSLHCSLSDVLLSLLAVPIRIICFGHVDQDLGDRA